MLELIVVLGVILLLVGINGLFVASEFAIINASRAALAARAARGDALSAHATAILEDPTRLDRYVATAQVGITVASLGLGMYGEHNLARMLVDLLAHLGITGAGSVVTAHGIATVISLMFVTYLHVVLGEMVPKSLALTHALETVRWVMRPMLLIALVFSPLVRALNVTGNALLRLVGFRRGLGASHYYDPAELEALVRESRESGLIPEEGERVFLEMIDFSDISAAEAMVPRVRVISIPEHAPAARIEEIVAADPHTRYPVHGTDLDQILGTVHIKDLLRLIRTESDLDMGSVREVPFVPMTATLEQVIALMNDLRNQMVVVMDEHGGTAGTLTIEDICSEAIGEVEEGPEDTPDLVQLTPDTYQVQGTVRLDTLGSALARDLGHAEVITVSGLFLTLLGRAARTGDTITWRGVQMRVTRVRGRGVAQAVLVVPDDHGPARATDPAPH